MNRQLAVAERIEHWPTDRLKPYARNARTHSPEQVDKIAASIVEFGFTNPILVDSDPAHAAIIDEAEVDTTPIGGYGRRILSDHWGIAVGDPSRDELASFVSAE